MLVHYTLDPGQSRFTVQAFAGGLLSVLAHSPVIAIRNFTGEVRFTPETLENLALDMTVQADSLAATDSVNPKDRPEIESRMRQEVLETATHPKVTFRSTQGTVNKVTEGWYRVRFGGEMTLHGVTRNEAIDAQLRLADDGLRLSGDFRMLLSAYKIRRVSALGGTIQLKDEIKFSFDLAGARLAS
jgi:polyisoprenoid-binding protein YceI